MEKDEIRKILGDKDNKILRLEKELERIKKSLRNERYGLAWIDVPEAFEDDVENKLPIVTSMPKLDIKNDDGKPTHLLIEAENYHALTCLNYTHKGKVDVIYIDPPYNTGTDGFRYKDKRILDKYPDGTEVPTDHPLRHSYWLSFMRKRLELAKDLLSDKGIIFISIDDNEIAQLKLLCDQIFSDTSGKGYIGTLIWQRAKGGGNSKKVVRGHDYVLCYSKSDNLTLMQRGDKAVEHFKKYKSGKTKDRYVQKDGVLYFVNDDVIRRVFGKYEKGTERRCEYENLLKFKGAKTKADVDQRLAEGEYVLKKAPGGMHYVCRLEKVADMRQVMYTIIQGFLSEVGKADLAKLGLTDTFDYPKPVGLIKILLDTIFDKNAIVLDFFAGSGTTGQATIELNAEDKGSRQFILCTNNEEIGDEGEKVRHRICSDVCYPRLKRVIEGYKGAKGLGGSLKYYRIGFTGENSILNANDKDKLALAHNASELLAIAENTLEGVTKNSHFEIFENKDRYTAIYFKESFDKFDDFTKKVLSLKKPTTVYIFSWENDPFVDEFEDNPSITVKTIPEPILEIYRRIHNL